jgi:hypothetical protein
MRVFAASRELDTCSAIVTTIPVTVTQTLKGFSDNDSPSAFNEAFNEGLNAFNEASADATLGCST